MYMWRCIHATSSSLIELPKAAVWSSGPLPAPRMINIILQRSAHSSAHLHHSPASPPSADSTSFLGAQGTSPPAAAHIILSPACSALLLLLIGCLSWAAGSALTAQ